MLNLINLYLIKAKNYWFQQPWFAITNNKTRSTSEIVEPELMEYIMFSISGGFYVWNVNVWNYFLDNKNGIK